MFSLATDYIRSFHFIFSIRVLQKTCIGQFSVLLSQRGHKGHKRPANGWSQNPREEIKTGVPLKTVMSLWKLWCPLIQFSVNLLLRISWREWGLQITHHHHDVCWWQSYISIFWILDYIHMEAYQEQKRPLSWKFCSSLYIVIITILSSPASQWN